MLDPLSTLENISSVAAKIYDQVQLVKANKEQCRSLVERIRIIESALKGLGDIREKEQFKLPLTYLLAGLNEALTLITQFSTSSRWERWILKAGNYKGSFQDINEKLSKSSQQLNLGLNAQQIINHEQDKKDQAADTLFINANQKTIIQLTMDGIQKAQGNHLAQEEKAEVARLQLQAIQSQLTVIAKATASVVEDKYRIHYYDLVFEECIATGSFGKVYRGKWEGQTVAIKTVEGELTPKEEEQFNREVAIMSQLRHPNITCFYGASLEAGHACIVMEYMEKGPLDKLLQKPLILEQQTSFSLDIIQGLLYLHKKGNLHRDLKSANVLISQHGVAKLTDFGLSKTQAAQVMTTIERSQALQWQAPECFQFQGKYTAASDIYSFGVVLWEIVTGKFPPLRKDTAQYATCGERWEIPQSISPFLGQLIKGCWAVNASQRPVAESIKQQLEGYKISALEQKASLPADACLAQEHYEDGETFEKQKNFSQALQSYQKAAADGHFRAKGKLGVFYLTGRSGVVDKQKAFAFFLGAAEQGHVRSMLNLANMLEYGDGVTKNIAEALRWYTQVCRHDPKNPDAPAKCQKLKALLDEPSYQLESTVASLSI